MLGRVEPTTVTPPLRADLWTNEDSSWGYVFAAFCALIGWPLREWQRRLAIRLGELYLDGTPRFRKALILIARQNGKSLFGRLLILFWMTVERVPEILATSTDRAAAKRFWVKVCRMAEANKLLAETLPARHVALQIGEEAFWNSYGSTYRFAAPTRRAGRGDTLDRALLDELREHRNRDVWDAVSPAQNAVADALLVAISNEGDAESLVLHEEADAAAEFIATGIGDERAFFAAWSAPTGCEPDDVEALAMANPSLGDGLHLDALLGQAAVAKRAGGETLARFRIEILCQRIDLIEGAIRPEDWTACGVKPEDAIDLAEHRRDTVLCFDVAWDATHATVSAAAEVDGIVHLDMVAAFDGIDARKQLRAALPDLVRRVRPRKVTWFAGGPAAGVADSWPGKRLANVRIEAISAADAAAACMGFEEQAAAEHLRHPNDPLGNEHVRQSSRMPRGDGWVFCRRGRSPIDAVYAMAGAVHGARTLPKLGPVA